MCTRDKEFTIRGIGDCLARGYDRTAFSRSTPANSAPGRCNSPNRASSRRRNRRLPGRQQAAAARRRGAHRGAPPSGAAATPSAPLRPRGPRNEAAATHQSRGDARPGVGRSRHDRRLFGAGADVFRINMSHTNHDRMRELVASIRAVEAEHNRPIGILVDLQGPKLRLGAFKTAPPKSTKGRDSRSIPIPYPATPRGCNCRTRKSSPPSSRATVSDRRRQAAPGRDRGHAAAHRHAMSRSAAKCRTARASACPTPSCRWRR